MPVNIEDRIAEAEAKRTRAMQRKCSAERDLARLGKRLTGAAKAQDTRRKVLVGVACLSLLADARVPVALRNKIRASLRSRLTEVDGAVVADLLTEDVVQ